MKIYYAHHIWKYNTEIEKYEENLIKNHFKGYEILNPAVIVDQSNTENEIMRDCFRMVMCCDILVFSSVDGVVGKGVYEEIRTANNCGKPIYYIYHNKLNIGYKLELLNSDSNRTYAKVEVSNDNL